MENYIGRVFERWTVTSAVFRKALEGQKHSYVCVVCACGSEKEVRLSAIKSGTSKSCGCLAQELKSAQKIHPAGSKKSYSIWHAMKNRCENVAYHGYSRYGGRGITICERWHTFSNFYSDMGNPPEGLQLDRIDNNLGYNPENCRWVTAKENNRNKSSNIRIDVNGIPISLMVLADTYGLDAKALRQRHIRGDTYPRIVRPARKSPEF